MTFEILTIIVLLNVGGTITLWQQLHQAARKPPKLKKKFLNALLHSEPITPRYDSPKSISGSLVTADDRVFFSEFTDFAAVVNWWFADKHDGSPWRLQELPDTELKLDFSDMPDYGRRYAVFHNQVRLGTLEVSCSFDYSIETPNVRTNIELGWVRVLTFYTVQEFLAEIAMHVSDKRKAKEYLETHQAIDRALTQVLWQAQHISEFGMDGEEFGDLEVQLNGSASWYLARREALRKRQAAR